MKDKHMPVGIIKARLCLILLVVAPYTLHAELIDGISGITDASAPVAQVCKVNEWMFTHAMGDSCIPVAPKRIAALTSYTATPLFDLGAPVIATSGRWNANTKQHDIFYATQTFGITIESHNLINLESAGSNEIDIEALAAAKPDLIVVSHWGADRYEQYARIAPTVVEPVGFGFDDRMQFMANITNRNDVLQMRMAHYEQSIVAARKQIGDTSSITLSRLFLTHGKIAYYRGWGALAKVIKDLGFSEPTPFATTTQEQIEFSAERLMEFDGDLILSAYEHASGQSVSETVATWDRVVPFWRQLPGVKKNNHFWFERAVWHSETFTALDEVVDTLVTLTAGRSFD